MKWRKAILLGMVLTVCGVSLASSAFAALSADRGLYAVGDATGNFYRIDTATGAATVVGALVEGVQFSGLAYDTSTGTMYVSDVITSGGKFGLGRINLATGAVTVIGGHEDNPNIPGLAYDSLNNVLYVSRPDIRSLASIDRTTGESTVIGEYVNDAGPMMGLAYCPANDTLYGMDSTNICTIDKTTGVATVLGAHGQFAGVLSGLEFDENSGYLYASFHGDTDLYRIDLATGGVSSVGDTGIQIGGLASVPAQGDLSVLYINTMHGGDSAFLAGLNGMDIDGLSVVDAEYITPLTRYMQNFEVVLVATGLEIADPAALGDNLSDYVDGGGGLCLFPGALVSVDAFGLDGRIIGPDYSPLAKTIGTSTPNAVTASSFASHPITDGLTSLSANVFLNFTATQGAGQSLGTYDTNHLIGAYRDDKPIAVINVFPGDGAWGGDFIRMTENAIHWSAPQDPSPSPSPSAGTGGGGGGGCFISNLSYPFGLAR